MSVWQAQAQGQRRVLPCRAPMRIVERIARRDLTAREVAWWAHIRTAIVGVALRWYRACTLEHVPLTLPPSGPSACYPEVPMHSARMVRSRSRRSSLSAGLSCPIPRACLRERGRETNLEFVVCGAFADHELSRRGFSHHHVHQSPCCRRTIFVVPPIHGPGRWLRWRRLPSSGGISGVVLFK